jgi:segregation and condensation protein B
VPPLTTLLESVLLVTDQPVPAVTLAQVVEQPTDLVEAELTRLAQAYTAAGSGFDLRQVAGGWRLYTRPECAPVGRALRRDGQQARLTQAALETLAVVAYRQPVSRARVSAVRGVNVDGVVRSLLARGLLAEAGPIPETGGTLYVTTPLLLEKLGLDSLDACRLWLHSCLSWMSSNRTRCRHEVQMTGIRLQKVMAAAGVGSRRACEELIAQGTGLGGRASPSSSRDGGSTPRRQRRPGRRHGGIHDLLEAR